MSDLTLSGVTKSFDGTEVISPTDLGIEDGEFVVFVGPSGCGKSTMLRMIAGLEGVSGGTITLGGRDVTQLPPVERDVAMVFQSYALYPHMTVGENIAFGLRISGMSKSERRAKARAAADTLQLTDYLARKPKALSGGQRQRVAIGRAIVKEPGLFLFDEPLSNLDAELRVQMRLEIAALHQRLGATMIYVTHDQVEAMTLADKIVVLRKGVIEQVGTPIDLYTNPANAFVAGFIGSPKMNFIDGMIAEVAPDGLTVSAPALGDRRITVPSAKQLVPGTRVTLGIRPEHVRPATATGIPAKRQFVERLGNVAYAYMTLPDGTQITMEERGLGTDRAATEQMLEFDEGEMFAFAEGGTRL
ncbi:ABC transporter ATP-binding protein [Pelagovum pacificum]|uniref:sn-glycerol-3-phosphate ABC transporter ATP-binding protein UgpC n=1 Tax=Pelagovum pacificum TaxID=2588711 RepID=A0A5C5GAK6_9RHOB|nr:sn-glycerol-3-phosphate ABC transporter ATP-binding protein UgpC [Pelagovum pacificum]QQA41765.1 sn-glycerol-3-phosphate ABC transporter ATP-binding protein UgpC [Pelagovum pacificum]TNY31038.1 sn-glycerol-3-phosphate ABC transporter ATP-binding protein UgpC [Pelagovum pacificum]